MNALPIDGIVPKKKSMVSFSNFASSKEESLKLSDTSNMFKTHESIVIKRSRTPTPSINKNKEKKIVREFPECEQMFSSQRLFKGLSSFGSLKDERQFRVVQQRILKMLEELSAENVIQLYQIEGMGKSTNFRPLQISVVVKRLQNLLCEYFPISASSLRSILNSSLAKE